MKSLAAIALMTIANVCHAVTPTPIYSQTFESGVLGSEWTGGGSIQSSQGLFAFGGFGQKQLRNQTSSPSILTLTDLPAHSAVVVDFSLATWDGLDPNVDRFAVMLDGKPLILPTPIGAGLGLGAKVSTPHVSLGYGPSIDSAFFVSLFIFDSSSTFRLQFLNPAAGTNDGSFGLDNFYIRVIPATPVPEPSTFVLTSLGLVAWRIRSRRRAA